MSPHAQADVPPVGQGLGFTAWEALYQAFNKMSAGVEKALQPHGITLQQLYLLLILDQAEDGEMQVGQIGRRMVRASQTMTGLTDRAEACGWVEKIYDRPGDRRTTTVAITAAGKEKLQEGWPITVTLLEGFFRMAAGLGCDVAALKKFCATLQAVASAGANQ